MDKLTKQEYNSAIRYKEVNNLIEEKVDKYRNQLWNEVNNVDYLDECNYKYEKYKQILRKGYSKYAFVIIPTICVFLLSIISWSIKHMDFLIITKVGHF